MKLHPSRSGRRSPKILRGSSMKGPMSKSTSVKLRSESPSVRAMGGKNSERLSGSGKSQGGKSTKLAFSFKRLKSAGRSGRSKRFGSRGSDGSASQTAAVASEIIPKKVADEKDEKRSAANEVQTEVKEEREQPSDDERELPSGEEEAVADGDVKPDGEAAVEEEAEVTAAKTNEEAETEEEDEACDSFPNSSRTRSDLSISTKGSSKGGGSAKCPIEEGSTLDPFLRDCEYSVKTAPGPTMLNAQGLCALDTECSTNNSCVSLQQRLKDQGELLDDLETIRAEDRGAACRPHGGFLGELCSPLERDLSRDWRGEDDVVADPNNSSFPGGMVRRRSQGTLATKDETVDTMEILLSPRFNTSPDNPNRQQPLTSLGLFDLLKLPIQKWDELRDEIAALAWLTKPADEGTVRSNPFWTSSEANSKIQ